MFIVLNLNDQKEKGIKIKMQLKTRTLFAVGVSFFLLRFYFLARYVAHPVLVSAALAADLLFFCKPILAEVIGNVVAAAICLTSLSCCSPLLFRAIVRFLILLLAGKIMLSVDFIEAVGVFLSSF